MTSDEIERGAYIFQECLEHPDLENSRLIYADWCKDFDVWNENHLRELVLKHPENDAPRLIYANFCAENKDYSREKLIRMQISLTKLKSAKSAFTFPGTLETLENYQRDLAHSIINGVVPYLPQTYSNFRIYSRNTLLALDGVIAGNLDFPAVFSVGNPAGYGYPPDTRIEPLHAFVRFKRGFLTEIQEAPLLLWKIHGKQLVREHPIEFIHFPEIDDCIRLILSDHYRHLYETNPHYADGDLPSEIIGWQLNTALIPNWLKNSPNFPQRAPIFFRNNGGRELLLKWMSNLLINWAKN